MCNFTIKVTNLVLSFYFGNQTNPKNKKIEFFNRYVHDQLNIKLLQETLKNPCLAR